MIKRRIIIYGSLTLFLTLVYLTVYGEKNEIEPDAIAFNFPLAQADESNIPVCNTRGLSLNARSVLIVDNKSGAWIYSKNPMKVRSVASLTKFLTAMVYLDTKPDLDSVVYISGRDCYNSAKSHIYKGEAYAARDLLYAALMASDNRAARAIATSSGIPRLKFIKKMNEKAREIGMRDTEIFEVTGLDERNVSNSADMAILIQKSLDYPEIMEATSRYTYRCKLKNKNRYKNFINTNRLIRSRWEVLAGKTGFIFESDYCLATVLKDKRGGEITVVVLGSPTNNIRFDVARKLAFFGFKRAGRYDNGSQQIAGR
ncbi:MAG: serine hydrolase [candidate division Zixibacteria bacterium]